MAFSNVTAKYFFLVAGLTVFISWSYKKKSASKSIAPENLQHRKHAPHLCVIKGPELRSHGFLETSVAESLYLWKPKQIVKVLFMDDDALVAERVLNTASEWTQYSGIKFIRTGLVDEADIRVSFKTEGWWSYIGSYSKKVKKNEATLSLDSIYMPEFKNEFKNTVLHEFGHALGLIHEHQHPAFEIPWKKAELFKYYKDTYKADSNWVKQQVIEKYNSKTGIYCTPDPKSIMIYKIPPGVTENDKYVTDWPSELSDLDKKNINLIYLRKKCL